MAFSYKERTNEELVALAVEAVNKGEVILGVDIDQMIENQGFDFDEGDAPTEDGYIEALTAAESDGFIDLTAWDQANQLAEYEEGVINRAEDDKHFGAES